MDLEYKTNKHIRDRETDINGYLRTRHKELMEPLLFVALFDTERNDAAKKGWKEQVTQFFRTTQDAIVCRDPDKFLITQLWVSDRC